MRPWQVTSQPKLGGQRLVMARIYAFDHLTVIDGLSENSVRTIMEDHLGFLWFGTQEGLNQYDGYDFTVYKTAPDNPAALSDAFITSIVEDPTGILWVGTYYGGLNRFDRETGRFRHFHLIPLTRERCLRSGSMRC